MRSSGTTNPISILKGEQLTLEIGIGCGKKQPWLVSKIPCERRMGGSALFVILLSS